MGFVQYQHWKRPQKHQNWFWGRNNIIEEYVGIFTGIRELKGLTVKLHVRFREMAWNGCHKLKGWRSWTYWLVWQHRWSSRPRMVSVSEPTNRSEQGHCMPITSSSVSRKVNSTWYKVSLGKLQNYKQQVHLNYMYKQKVQALCWSFTTLYESTWPLS